MRGVLSILTSGLLAAAIAGCHDNTPPPPRVPFPVDHSPRRERDDVKPMPDQSRRDLPPPPYQDVPLVSQQAPEQQPFIEAWAASGRPRILVLVNRTLEGELLPVNPEGPLLSVEHNRRSNAGVSVERRQTDSTGGYYRDDRTDRSDRFETKGPADYRESTEVYLRPGEYDEVAARSVDYEAIENVLTDWLSADGKVAVVSPVFARKQLSDQQVKDLQGGRPRVLSEIGRQLDADVLVQVQARPTRQSEPGLGVRIIAEAMRVGDKGGQSLARAFVDVPPPLDKPQINKYTRFLARKLMDGMIQTWNAAAPGAARPPAGSHDAAAPSGPEITITLADDGTTQMDGRVYTPGELRDKLSEAVKRDPETQVRVQASEGAAERHWNEVTDVFRQAGVKEAHLVPPPAGAATLPSTEPATRPDAHSGVRSDQEIDAAGVAAASERGVGGLPAAPPEQPITPGRDPGPAKAPPMAPPEVPMPPGPGSEPDLPVGKMPATREKPIPPPAPPSTNPTTAPSEDADTDAAPPATLPATGDSSGDTGDGASRTSEPQRKGASVRGFQRVDND